MLLQALAAIWGTNISPSAKAKATIHRRAQMLVMLKRYMIASIQQLTAAFYHAYVSLVTEFCY